MIDELMIYLCSSVSYYRSHGRDGATETMIRVHWDLLLKLDCPWEPPRTLLLSCRAVSSHQVVAQNVHTHVQLRRKRVVKFRGSFSPPSFVISVSFYLISNRLGAF